MKSLRTHLSGYWKLNDNAANTTIVSEIDNGGEDQDGQSVGNNTEDMSDYGRVKDALTFNGSGDWLNCGHIDGVQVPGKFTCTGLAYDPTDDTFWMGDYSNGKIIHTTRPTATTPMEKLGEISAGAHIQGIAYDCSDDTLWWSDMDNDYLRHIDKEGNSLGDDIDVSAKLSLPCGLSYEAATDSLWVCELGTDLHHFNAGTGSWIETFTIMNQLDGCCYDPSDDTLYLSVDGPPDYIKHVDASDGSVLNSYKTVAFPEDIAIGPDGTLWMLSDISYHSTELNANRLYNLTKGGVLINGITDEFTLAGWIYLDSSISGYSGIVARRRSSSAGAFQLLTYTSGGATILQFRVYAGGNYVQQQGSTNLELERWHFVVAKYDGGHMYIYLNHVLEAGPTLQSGNIDLARDEVQIGRVALDTMLWKGKISDVMIFDKALDYNEMAYLWNGGYGRELDLQIRPTPGQARDIMLAGAPISGAF